jgi:hypothetical protein
MSPGNPIWRRLLNGSNVTREVNHPISLTTILLALGGIVAYLAEPRGLKQGVKVLAIALAFLVTLMGLGAVFGKTLGDFLRGPPASR